MSRLRSTSWAGDPWVKPPFGSITLDDRFGLIADAWLFNEDVGLVSENLAALHRVATRSATQASWKFTNKGPGIACTGAGSLITYPSETLTPPYTCVLDLRFDTAPTGPFWGGANGNYAFYIDSTNIYHRTPAGNCTVVHGGLSQGLVYRVVVVRPALTGAVSFYLDGQPLGSPSLNTGETLQLSSFGGYEDQSSIATAATYVQAAVFSVPLTAGVIASWTTEPYNYFRPIIRRRYFIPAQAPVISGDVFIQEHIGRGIGRGMFAGR